MAARSGSTMPSSETQAISQRASIYIGQQQCLAAHKTGERAPSCAQGRQFQSRVAEWIGQLFSCLLVRRQAGDQVQSNQVGIDHSRTARGSLCSDQRPPQARLARRRQSRALGHPNIEFFPLSRGIASQPGAAPGNPPSVRAWAQRDYGNRVGIWRLMDVLSKHGIRASPTLNSDICDHHPQIVRAIELGWEILGHNRNQQRVARHLEP